MGFAPVHQRRCSTGLRGNQAPMSAGLNYSRPGPDRPPSWWPAETQPVSAYTLSGIPGHIVGVPPPSTTLSFDPDSWYYEKYPVPPGRGKRWSYS
jgi:hypothetical protein